MEQGVCEGEQKKREVKGMGKPLWARPSFHGHAQEELSICRNRNDISYCPISMYSGIIHAGRKKQKKKRDQKLKKKVSLNYLNYLI